MLVNIYVCDILTHEWKSSLLLMPLQTGENMQIIRSILINGQRLLELFLLLLDDNLGLP